MADFTSAASTAAPIVDPSAVERAERFTLERFVHAGEDPAVALAPGSGRRQALDTALAEIDAGASVPSTRWRRRYSLLLGLERLLSEDEPRLADGTTLNPHQVDALSGTLTALLAEAQRNGDAAAPVAAPVLAVDDDEDDEDDDESPLRPRSSTSTTTRTTRTTTTRTRPPRPTRGRTTRSPTSTRTSSRSTTTPTPTSASGSSTPPAPARPSPRWASSRPRAPAAS